jgi:hypothetical protein
MPGEVNLTDSHAALPPDESLPDRVVSIARHAETAFEDELEAYAADLHLFGTYSGGIDETVQVMKTQIEYAKKCRDSPYPEISLLRLDSLEAQDQHLSIGQALLSLSHHTAREVMPTDAYTQKGGIITGQLLAQNRDPATEILRWNTAARTILKCSAQTLATSATQLSMYLDPIERQAVTQNAMAKAQTHLSYREGPPGLGDIVERIHDPSSSASRLIPTEFSIPIIRLYEKWLSAARSSEGAYEKAVSIFLLQNTLEIQAFHNPKATERKTLSDTDLLRRREELAALIDTPIDASKLYNPSWNSLKASLKPFANELLRQSRKEKDPLPIPEDANKRITGRLRVLEQLGNAADPTKSFEKLKSVVIEEYPLTRKIEAYTRMLAAANVESDLSKWHPVTDDIALIEQQWDRIKPIIEKSWSPSQGTPSDTIAAIERSVAQFTAAQQETKNQLVKEEVKGAMDHPLSDGDSRRRAAVVNHFMALGDSQLPTKNNTDLGTIFWTDSSRGNYFCVTFNDALDKGWALLEAFTNDETFVIPVDTIHEYGSVAEFVELFDEEMQHEFGQYRLSHEPDWTAESHIARVTARVGQV